MVFVRLGSSPPLSGLLTAGSSAHSAETAPLRHTLFTALNEAQTLRDGTLPRRAGPRPEYDVLVARRADDYGDDTAVDAINDSEDTSLDALNAWIAELQRDDDWIELPVSAAELIAEDRAALSS